MTEVRTPAWQIAGDNAAIALICLLFFGAFFHAGFAGDGMPRALAWCACGVLGIWGAIGWATGRLSEERCAPARWMVALMAIAVLVTGVMLVPLPTETVVAISPLWRGVSENFATAGLTMPERIPLAIAPESGLRAWQQLVAAALFFLGVAVIAGRRSGATWLIAVVCVATVAEGLIGLFRFLVLNAHRANGAVYNANHHAVAVVMGIPLCVAALREWRGRSRMLSSDPLGGGNPVLLFYALLFAAMLGWAAAFSRSSLLFSTLVIVPWGVMEVRAWRSRRGENSPGGTWVVGAALLVAALALSWLFVGGLAERLFRGDALSGNSRVEIWRATLAGLRESGWMGLGLGGTEFAINRHAGVPLVSIPIWAHNDYVQWLADFGAPAAGVLLVPAVGLALAIWRVLGARREKTTFAERALPRACAAGLAIALLHASTDFHLRIPLVGFMALTLLALVLQTGSYRIHGWSR